MGEGKQTTGKKTTGCPLAEAGGKLLCSFLVAGLASAQPYEEPIYVMPLGDSLTTGQERFTDEATGGYRPKLESFAKLAGMRLDFVGSQQLDPACAQRVGLQDPDHEGWDGYYIDGKDGDGETMSLARVIADNQLIARVPLSFVILLIGSNDVARDPKNQPDADEVARRYGRLLDAIYAQNPNVLVLATGIPPTHPNPDHEVATKEQIETFNRTVKTFVTRRSESGNRIVYVDTAPFFEKPEPQIARTTRLPNPETGQSEPDGVLLTQKGSDDLGAMFFGAIQGIYWEADGLYEDSTDLGNGWRWSHFGRFWDGGQKAAGWKYLENHGWLYCPPGHASTFVAFHPGKGWKVTEKDAYPKWTAVAPAQRPAAPATPMPSEIPAQRPKI